MSEDSIEQGIYQNLESLLSQAQEQEQRANAEAARANYQQVLEFAQEEATAAPNLDWEALVGKAKAGLSRLDGQTYHDVEATLSQAQEQEQHGNTEAVRSMYQQVAESAREQMQAAPDWDWETLIRSAEAGISRLDARNYVRRGKEAMQQHEFVPAAGAFRTAVEKLGSDDPEARQGLDQAYMNRGVRISLRASNSPRARITNRRSNTGLITLLPAKPSWISTKRPLHANLSCAWVLACFFSPFLWGPFWYLVVRRFDLLVHP